MVTPVTVWLARAVALWLCCWLLQSSWRTLRMLWLSRNMPGLPPFRIVLRSALGLSGHPTAMQGRLLAGYKAYGSPWRLWFGPFLAVFVGEPDDVQVILNNPATQEKPPLYESVSAVFGLGLISINGDDFKRHRKALAPSFHIGVLRGFLPLFNKAGASVCDDFEEMSKTGEVFNSTQTFKRITTDTVLKSFLCCDDTDLKEQRAGIVKAVNRVNEMMMYFVQRPWFWNRIVRRLVPCYKEYAEMCEFIDLCVRIALDKKLKTAKNGTMSVREEEIPEDEVGTRRKVLLDHIVSSGNFRMLSMDELVCELKHICGAALGTSSDFLSFLAIALALNQDIQEKVYEELMEVFEGDLTRPATQADLDRLEYLERVLLEVLRYFPTVPGLARQCSEDLTMPSGVVIPKGAIIVIILRAVHFNPRYYTDPYAFNPDRFLPENLAGLPKYAYIPFSDGNRTCIGKRWGMLFVKTMAANYLRQYQLLPDPNSSYKTVKEVKTILGISLEPVGGAPVRVQRRPQISKPV